MDIGQVAGTLGVETNSGLAWEEGALQLTLYGPNKLSEKIKTIIWQRSGRQLNNVLVLILVIMAVVSAVKAATSTGEFTIISWVEEVLILGVFALNTYIGIRQEGSAENSAEALKAMLSSSAIVIGNGNMIEIDAADLVKADIIKLFTGDKIPADIRLTKATFTAQKPL